MEKVNKLLKVWVGVLSLFLLLNQRKHHGTIGNPSYLCLGDKEAVYFLFKVQVDRCWLQWQLHLDRSSSSSKSINKLQDAQAEKLTSWQIDRLPDWQDDKRTEWQDEEMKIWQDDKMTRWQDDRMTRQQDYRSCQILPKAVKNGKFTKRWQILPNFAKSCWRLPNVANRLQKLTKIAKYCNKLSKVTKNFQLLAKVVKSCQNLTWWHKWWNGDTMTKWHDDMMP